MPRPTKKPKKPQPAAADDPQNDLLPRDAETAAAIAEPPVEQSRAQMPEIPSEPVEAQRSDDRPTRRADHRSSADGPKTDNRPAQDRNQGDTNRADKDKTDKDHIATSLNIAKLQSMSMTELNQMEF